MADDQNDPLNSTPDSEPGAVSDDQIDSRNLTPESNPAEAPVSIVATPAQTLPPEGSTRATVTFMGNTYDLFALVGVTIGGVVLMTCVTCNLGYYCLPFVPIVLGVIGLATAGDSVNPERTRLLSWISLGSGAVILLLIILAIALYIGFIIFAIAMDNNGGF
jgi:hypothetical protein